MSRKLLYTTTDVQPAKRYENGQLINTDELETAGLPSLLPKANHYQLNMTYNGSYASHNVKPQLETRQTAVLILMHNGFPILRPGHHLVPRCLSATGAEGVLEVLGRHHPPHCARSTLQLRFGGSLSPSVIISAADHVVPKRMAPPKGGTVWSQGLRNLLQAEQQRTHHPGQARLFLCLPWSPEGHSLLFPDHRSRGEQMRKCPLLLVCLGSTPASYLTPECNHNYSYHPWIPH
jgi:hypothetical protein